MGNKNNREFAVLLGHNNHPSIEYPANHEFGMAVTLPGSSCNNCEYLKSGNRCGNEFFVKWNKGDKIPAKDMKAYCCDEWHPKD